MFYVSLFNKVFKKKFTYRLDLFLSAGFELIPLLGILFLWKEISSNEKEGTFSFDYLVTYTLVAKFLDILLRPSIQWDISENVKKGSIIKFMLRPISFMKYWFATHLSQKISEFIFLCIPFGFLGAFFMDHIITSRLDNILVFILSCFFSFFLYFLIYLTVAILSFWVIEIRSFFYTFDLITEFASGALIPFVFLSSSLQSILKFSPFSSMIYFPMQIYFGALENNDLYIGLGLQFFWCVVFLLTANYLWKKAVKSYDGAGA